METLTLLLIGLGFGCMVGLSGAGSAIGVSIAGAATVGAIKKKPEAFGVSMVLSALPATQGLYGFVGYIVLSGVVQQGVMPEPLTGAVIFAAGLALGVAALVSGLKQGQVCASGISAIGSGHNVFANTMILAAFPEFYAILALVAAILMTNMI